MEWCDGNCLMCRNYQKEPKKKKNTSLETLPKIPIQEVSIVKKLGKGLVGIVKE